MDPIIRKAFGPAYAPIIRLKGKMREAVALRGYIPYKLSLKRNLGKVEIDIGKIAGGFGSIIVHALQVMSYSECNNMQIYVSAISPLYSEGGQDVLSQYFEIDDIPTDMTILSQSATHYFVRHVVSEHMTLDNARRLYSRYFRPNKTLLSAINEVSRGIKAYDISVHFRGTDKYLESGFVNPNIMFNLIENELSGIINPHIFLATDDAMFAGAIRQHFPDATFSSYDIAPVDGNTPRHFSGMTPHEKSLEALVNIYLIARAPVCVRTSSFFSAISALVNPAMRTITINQTLEARSGILPFPEFEILSAEKCRSNAAVKI